MSQLDKPPIKKPAVRSFWLQLLGWVLLAGSVGLVSCQALFRI